MIVRTAVVVLLAALVGSCGGGEQRDNQRSQRGTDAFADFCEQNPGACDGAQPTRSLTPAVSARGWTEHDCPRSVLDPGPRALEGVGRAMRAAIPRLLSVSAYGHESTLAPENTNVLDVRPLTSDSVDLPGVNTLRGFSAYYERNARRLCGRRLASRSWAAILQFPEAQAVALSYRVMFFARTARGWRALVPPVGEVAAVSVQLAQLRMRG